MKDPLPSGWADSFPDEKVFPVLSEHRIPAKADRQVLADDYPGIFRGSCHDRSFPEGFGDHERYGLPDLCGIEGGIYLFGNSVHGPGAVFLDMVGKIYILGKDRKRPTGIPRHVHLGGLHPPDKVERGRKISRSLATKTDNHVRCNRNSGMPFPE